MTLPPVVLVHGLAANAQRTWRDNGWVDLLEDAGRTVTAPDLLGHGDADAPHDPAAYDALEEHLEATFPDGAIDAVGFSLGARSLLILASRTPERFRRLVVAGVGANLFRHDDTTVLADALDGTDATPPDWVRYFSQQVISSEGDPLAVAALLRRPGGPRCTPEAVAAITCPVLVILGDQDFAGPADPLVDALPDPRLVTLRGVDHFSTPKSFACIDAALDFLDG